MWFQLLLVICLNLSQTLSDVPYSRVVRQALYGNVQLYSQIQCMCNLRAYERLNYGMLELTL